MPEQGPQKVRIRLLLNLKLICWRPANCCQQVVDPTSIGGNSENTHPEAITRKESRPAVTASRIPVPESRRVPLKTVHVQPASRNTRVNKSAQETPPKTSEVCQKFQYLRPDHNLPYDMLLTRFLLKQ